MRPTRLTRMQLIERANRWCSPRYGVTVTPRLLRDWCERRLLPSPMSHGLGWGRGSSSEWGAEAHRSICKLCRIVQQGVTRTDPQRIILWLSGQYVAPKDLRKSCEAELRRYSRSKAFNQRSLKDASHDHLPKKTITGLARAVGQVDPRLVPDRFQYSEKERVDMISDLKEGTSRGSYAKALFAAEFQSHLPIGIDHKSLAKLFSGYLGSDDNSEGDGLRSIQSAEIAEFKVARELVRDFGRRLAIASRIHPDMIAAQRYKIASDAYRRSDFRIFSFLWLINLVHTKRLPDFEKKMEMGSPAVAEFVESVFGRKLPEIRQILEKLDNIK